jgi:hypothetical protein
VIEIALSMNIGPLVLANSGPPPGFDVERDLARLNRSASFLHASFHDLLPFRWAVVRRNR